MLTVQTCKTLGKTVAIACYGKDVLGDKGVLLYIVLCTIKYQYIYYIQYI